MKAELLDIKNGTDDKVFHKFYEQFVVQGKCTAELSPLYYAKKYGVDTNSMAQIGIQGLKGACAYADNAYDLLVQLKKDDPTFKKACENIVNLIHYFTHEAADKTVFEKMLDVGRVNLTVTELLDKYNADLNGNPQLAETPTKLVPGKCILVTGHDFAHLRSLLDVCEKKNINVYTHSEMSPAFMYPELKKYQSLKANFGQAWWKQQNEFKHFPGAILFTTNCIMKPQKDYVDRCFATGSVGYEEIKYIKAHHWDELIECALASEGFRDEAHCNDVMQKINQQPITGMVGFNHRVFTQMSGQLLQLIKDGKIKGFRYIGGCDGMNPKRKVFLDAATQLPKDWIILTGACGRFRINHENYGTIEGIPRLLDMGQCNDVYSAVVIMKALTEAMSCGINDLPIELYVSWYEQKATVQFLSLLALGVQNIKLGPTANVTITPNVMKVLEDKYKVAIIG